MKLHPKERSKSREDYKKAVEEFVFNISSIDNEKIDGILLYGSVARGDFIPGRSDIDIFMSLNYNVVTDPNLLIKIAEIVKDVTERKKVELNIGLYDLTVMQDGRFFTLGTGMEKHLALKGKVLYKNDPRRKLKIIDWKHTAENTMAFALRGIRKGLIDSLYYLDHDLKDFYNGGVSKNSTGKQ
jgi:predicted nucleotidyltransferase